MASRGSSAIKIRRTISCPTLSREIITKLTDQSVTRITRHIEKEYLSTAEGGYFRFGTIAGYAPDDRLLDVGRLGDREEGSQQEVFRTRSGYYNKFTAETSRIENVRISGFDNPIVVEFSANDYCSCSSIGDFQPHRAASFVANGNQKLGAYVTYDLVKLQAALSEVARERAECSSLILMGRPVVYGKKDRHWEIEETFARTEDRDPLAIYLGVTFVKSVRYEHEEEYRMLLVDPSALGQLPTDKGKLLEFNDPRIAAAIAASGCF